MSDLRDLSSEPEDGMQMILGTIKDNPIAARKFLVSTPALEKVKSQRKRPRTSQKDDTSSPKPSTSRSSSKKKKLDASADVIEVDDDEEYPPFTLAVYVSIPKNPAPTMKSRKTKANPDDVVKKGPFTLASHDTYHTFISKLAVALPCLPKHIYEQKITWKPVKPQNAQTLPLGGAEGYKIMLAAFSNRKQEDCMAVLTMPAPAQPMEEEMPWETGEAVDTKPVKFNYDELESVGPSDSIHQQQITFNKATKTERAVLEDKYPIGNHPAIDANKRIYHDIKTGYYFDLNVTRMGIWASAMAKKTTDENCPPMDSRFFDANQRIKNVSNNGPPIAHALPAVAPPLPPAPPAAPSLTELLLASLPLEDSLPVDNAQPRTALPSPVKRHAVSVEQFCEFYNIDAVDCARLADMGFRPGDPTEAKPDDDLKDAGFTIFGWKRIHNANLSFKGDLMAALDYRKLEI
ncbi:hypothetical protein K438DRAFT_2001225 [Mycena galopus ATCC 62051]|nr:hypothetical protein K438DRAFT_2001225 [Mycena galopus ATCC 62051]